MTATLPYRWYTDPEVLARERELLFAPAWQYAGHTGELDPGSYLTCRAGDVPIVVVRDRDGALRAFVNVCRHRGAEVVSGAGPCTTLQCHYHAWTYGLDGALRAAPRADDGLDRAALGLLPAAVDTWGPFMFVHADPEPPPLADTLGALPEIVAAGGLDVDALTFHHRSEYVLRPTGRSSSRTSWSATTARSRTRASATSSTSTTTPTASSATRRSPATARACARARAGRITTPRGSTASSISCGRR